MYEWLCRYLPPLWAALVISVWYGVLIFLVLLCWNGNEVFRYGRL